MRSSIRTGPYRNCGAARLGCPRQALIETALFSMVLVLMLALAANFAYVVYIGAGITSAGRQAATYAAQGQQSDGGERAAGRERGLPELPRTRSMDGRVCPARTGAPMPASPRSAEVPGQTRRAAPGNSNSTAPAYNADPESATFTVNAVKVSASPQSTGQLLHSWGRTSVDHSAHQPPTDAACTCAS